MSIKGKDGSRGHKGEGKGRVRGCRRLYVVRSRYDTRCDDRPLIEVSTDPTDYADSRGFVIVPGMNV